MEVLDLRTLVPLDWDAIVKSVSKTHNVIIVSEEVKRGSYAGELSAQIAEELFDELDAPGGAGLRPEHLLSLQPGAGGQELPPSGGRSCRGCQARAEQVRRRVSMAYEVLMPQLGLTMEEGTVSQWIKHEGDAVKAGDVVVEITTDKLTNEVTSEQDGVLLKIVAQEGEDVPVKGLLAYIGQPGEQVVETTAPAVSAASAAPSAAACGCAGFCPCGIPGGRGQADPHLSPGPEDRRTDGRGLHRPHRHRPQRPDRQTGHPGRGGGRAQGSCSRPC